MAATLSVRPNRLSPASSIPRPPAVHLPNQTYFSSLKPAKTEPWRGVTLLSRRALAGVTKAGSRADDSAPYDMSVESALKLLGVSETASFDEILRAKYSILDNCQDDEDAIAQVEAAYDMLLMRSLTQRRAGKVVDNSIRYADVNPVNTPGMTSTMPQWLQTTFKKPDVSVETPSASELGIQAGVYGALMVLTYVNGASTSSGTPYAGADVPGLILASSFGASLYFMTKKNIKLENLPKKNWDGEFRLYDICENHNIVKRQSEERQLLSLLGGLWLVQWWAQRWRTGCRWRLYHFLAYILLLP